MITYKECVACGRVFPPKRGVSPSDWATRRFCTQKCANRNSRPGANESRALNATMKTALTAVFSRKPIPAWYEARACRDTPVSVFYPDEGRGRNNVYDAARRICAVCPVIGECREQVMFYELGEAVRYGFCAGMTPRDRIRLQRQRRAS